MDAETERFLYGNPFQGNKTGIVNKKLFVNILFCRYFMPRVVQEVPVRYAVHALYSE